MATNFNTLLINTGLSTLENMPSIDIDSRQTDKWVLYDKNITRAERMAGDYYEDETLWKLIMWGNPDYECEFDIPAGTRIRIPWPKSEVLDEVFKKIINKKNLG